MRPPLPSGKAALSARGEKRELVAVSPKLLRAPPLPYRQGDLDGLCGIYAVINAVRLLHPALDTDAAYALFHKLARTLDRTLDDPMRCVSDGIGRAELEDLLITAREQLARHHRIGIKVEALVLWRKRPTLDDLWEALRDKLDGPQVAILELSGVKEHWTVGYAASETTLRLFDSGERRLLARSRCTLQRTTTRHRLHVKGVMLVRRKDPELDW